MKRLLTICSILSIVYCVKAQELTISELIKQPALQTANIFTSDKEDIANDWGVGITEKNGKYSVDMSNHLSVGNYRKREGYSYQGANITNVNISFDTDKNTRIVTVFLNEAEDINKVAKSLRNDINTLGIKMPSLSGGISRQNKKLPAPFTVVVISIVDDMIFFTYGFTEGGTPNF